MSKFISCFNLKQVCLIHAVIQVIALSVFIFMNYVFMDQEEEACIGNRYFVTVEENNQIQLCLKNLDLCK